MVQIHAPKKKTSLRFFFFYILMPSSVTTSCKPRGVAKREDDITVIALCFSPAKPLLLGHFYLSPVVSEHTSGVNVLSHMHNDTFQPIAYRLPLGPFKIAALTFEQTPRPTVNTPPLD